MRTYRGLADLSRYARALGAEVRSHLNTAPGFPVHHRVRPGHLRRLRQDFKSQHPAVRAHALTRLRRRILGSAH